MKPHRCSECDGSQSVLVGLVRETCGHCQGAGVTWVEDDEPVEALLGVVEASPELPHRT